jgi:hypothetical protein
VAASAQTFHLPGTQPIGSADPALAQIEDLFTAAAGAPPFSCDDCHHVSGPPGSAGAPAAPFASWQGGMMAHAARDPLFWAQLDLTNADAAVRPAVAGMGDLCLRCHSPVGWLEGRSTDTSGLGFNAKDVHGVQCHACHRLVDPRIADYAPAHPDIANILSGLAPMPGPTEDLRPTTYGNGMYVMDRKHVRRGPYGLAQLSDHTFSVVGEGLDWGLASGELHPVMNSQFHRHGNLCGTCHDVSNTADCEPGATKGETQRCFPIERTWTEWRHSSFYDASQPGGGQANNCQSCHMSGPLNGVNQGAPCAGVPDTGHFGDIHHHDLTGGNLFMLRVIKDMRQRYAACAADPACNCAGSPGCADGPEQRFMLAVNGLYPPVGGNPFATVVEAALDEGIARVKRTLRRAAFLEVTSLTPATLSVRVTNRTGHKLPTGYPEGRRMWLGVRFLDAGGALLAESGRYDDAEAKLYHDQNLDGLGATLMGAPGEGYDVVEYTNASVATTGSGRPTKVWEGRLDYDPGGGMPAIDFHFALNNRILMDNRIPPQGWNLAGYTANRALPVIPAVYTANGWQGNYGATVPPQVNFDDVSYPLPAGAIDRAELTLYYQTASREYVEALQADNPGTLTAGTFNRGTLLYEAWERSGKSERVEMARLVRAVADADLDGLSDGWEAAHGLSASPSGGRNDDPDGDGLSNWQEFQGGSNPSPPLGGDDPTPGGVRDPVDVVLVLDKSGSMSDAAPGTTTPKMAVLVDSVRLFLELWKDYAVPGDRIGLVYFDTNSTAFGAPPLLKPFSANWQAMLTDVEGTAAGGWTAMGAGLHTALEGLAGSTNAKHVILFSNGMQNRSPMIVDGGASLVLRDQTGADNPDVTGPSNVVLGGSDYAIPSDVKVHTIGIGVAGSNSAGDGWHVLLQDLAAQQTGKHNFITRAYDLEGVFLEDLVESLKGNSLQYVDDHQADLAPGAETTFEIPVSGTASRFSAVVSWTSAFKAAPQLQLQRPDGVTEDVGPLTRGGATYRVLTRYLGQPEQAPHDFGRWRLRVSNQGGRGDVARGGMQVRLHAVLDEKELHYGFSLPRRLRVGQRFRVAAVPIVERAPVPGLDDITLTLLSPGAALGPLLAASQRKLPPDAILDPDLGSSPYARKLIAAIADDAVAGRLKPRRSVFSLRDDGKNGDARAGNGVYEINLPAPTVPGHYQLRFRLAGRDRFAQPVLREETHSVVVRIGKIDVGRSRLHRRQRGERSELVFRPVDVHGNLLGPGFRQQVIAFAGKRRLVVEDGLDGTYSAALPPGFKPEETVRLVMDREPVYEGILRAAPTPTRGGGRN